MINIEDFAQSVQRNCHISDANYAGYYSMCVFLLKMREYYRWEKKIPLSHSLTKSEVGDWLSDRECDWHNYENETLSPIYINNRLFDPFQTEEINQILNPHGYVYSGGYGIFRKPHFFLAELQEKKIQDGHCIYVSGNEIARDLVAPPALITGNQIFIRKESLRRYIWEKIEEWRWKSDANTPMARALACYPKIDIELVLTQMCDNECNSAILHEIGEARATSLLGSEWKEMLYQLPHSELELKLRAIKDHLADSLSTLPGLVENENIPAIHFYFANFSGMRKEIYPEAIRAYNEWIDTNNMNILEKLCKIGTDRWMNIASRIKEYYLDEQIVRSENIDLLLAK